MGYDLHGFQSDVFDVALERRKDGTWHHRKVGLAMARQQSKTLLLAVRVALELLEPRTTTLYTSTDRGLAVDRWLELCTLLEASGFRSHIANIVRAMGREHLVTTEGSVFKPVTPSSRSGGRGISAVSLVVIDEAAMLRDHGPLGAILPTTLTRPAQVWMASNAGESELLAPVWWSETLNGREAITDPKSTAAWFEWCPDGDPAEIDPTDPKVWAEAMPTMGLPYGTTEEGVELLLRSMPLDRFARECLNLWAPSRVATVITAEAWAACMRPEVVVEAEKYFGLDVAPDGIAAALGVCGPAGEFRPVEVVDARPGTSWVVARTTELARRHGAPVVVSAASPAGAFVPQLEANGVEIRLVDQRDYAYACGQFLTGVTDGWLCHLGDWRLDEAVAGATRRQSGDLWHWNRRGGVNIAPLCAVTLALWPTLPEARKPTPQIW